MPRALLSVWDKQGLLPLAKTLEEKGYELVSTGKTRSFLEESGIRTKSVEEMTKTPELFDGRVKTLHPSVAGGILLRRDRKEDLFEAERHGIEPIDIVVVNLYPFADGWKKHLPEEELIELIDIGGVTLLRSAAKNHRFVTVVSDPRDYPRVIEELRGEGKVPPDLRKELAVKAFQATASYDALILEALSSGEKRGIMLEDRLALRYGENPHQEGAYFDRGDRPRGWKILREGEKKVSYLNILDASAAWNLVCDFTRPTSACIKHANPSGVASHDDIDEAFQRSFDADKLSAFGVIIALNATCTEAIIRKIIDRKIFTEVIIAPAYEEEALELLKQKPKIRVLSAERGATGEEVRSVFGGLLLQTEDRLLPSKKDLQCVTTLRPTEEQILDLLFAWKVVKHAKSNAIVYAKDEVTVGIGCGQTSRVDATMIAGYRAKERSRGAVMASDAFFPFPDALDEAHRHGITSVIQPGGSVRDAEVFARADELGMSMVLTGVRAFKH